jgi:hypothetical protein
MYTCGDCSKVEVYQDFERNVVEGFCPIKYEIVNEDDTACNNHSLFKEEE